MSDPELHDLEARLRSAPGADDAASGAAAAASRFARRAADDGLADLAYAVVDSPLGPLLAATGPRGLVQLAYLDFLPFDQALEHLSRRLSPRIVEAPARLDEVRRQLDEYFAGRSGGFDLPIDLSLAHGFGRRVLQAAARIPFGRVETYRTVARRAGNERASRAAGNALGANPIPIVVPCHRVVRTGGGLGGYTGGIHRKEFLLSLERGEPT
jgi:methylated-DNA-[protein]-cysteine S-methyltransferase